MGIPLNITSWDTWIGIGLVFTVSVVLFELARREFAAQWSETQEEIQKIIKREEAA